MKKKPKAIKAWGIIPTLFEGLVGTKAFGVQAVYLTETKDELHKIKKQAEKQMKTKLKIVPVLITFTHPELLK